MTDTAILSTPKVKRFGKNQLTIISALRNGHSLNRFFENDAQIYFLEGSGEMSPDSVKRLIERGALSEQDDAMFGVGMSFTLNPDYPFDRAESDAA